MPSSSTPATATAELLAGYRLLGLATTASAEVIRRRYHQWARQWHPDGFTGRDDLPLAEAKMKAIKPAREAHRYRYTLRARRHPSAEDTGPLRGRATGAR